MSAFLELAEILSSFNVFKSHYHLYCIQLAHCIYFSKKSNMKLEICFNSSSLESCFVLVSVVAIMGAEWRERKKIKTNRQKSEILLLFIHVKNFNYSKKHLKCFWKSSLLICLRMWPVEIILDDFKTHTPSSNTTLLSISPFNILLVSTINWLEPPNLHSLIKLNILQK